MKPDEAFPSLLGELRALAAHLLAGERASHTLQPTALVNEAYARLAARGDVSFTDRLHVIRTAVQAMNHVLIDHARGRNRKKRAGSLKRLGLDDAQQVAAATDSEYEVDDLLELNDALATLERDDPQLATVVRLRVYAGMEMADIAATLEISERTAYNDLAAAKARLRKLVTA